MVYAGTEARKLKIALLWLIASFASGCALPVPLSYLSYGRMAYDANQIIQGDATTTDVALSLTTGMDCQILNVLEDKDICARKVEKNELSYHDADNHSDSLCLGLQ